MMHQNTPQMQLDCKSNQLQVPATYEQVHGLIGLSNLPSQQQTINENHAPYRDLKQDQNGRKSQTQGKQSLTNLIVKPYSGKRITVNTPFVTQPLQKHLPRERNLMVKSDMGTGKTSAIIDQIAIQPNGCVTIMVNHLRALVEGTTNRINEGMRALGVNKCAVSYDGLNEGALFGASAVVTTINSLPKVVSLLASTGQKVHLLVIDESESVAQFITSNALNNASEVSQALNNLENGASHIVLMDAHLGTNTLTFARSYLRNTAFNLLENNFTRWGAFTYEWAGESEAQGLALIESKLREGLRLFVTATSRERAESIEAKLRLRGSLDGLKVLKGFGSGQNTDIDSEELKAAKADHSLFNQYDLVIASPNIGVGVSIESPKGQAPHFDAVISFMVRHKDTPDALGALQMPFRVRDTTTKHLYLIKLDFAEQGKPRNTWQIRQDLKHSQAQYDLLLESNVPEQFRKEFLKQELQKFSTFEAAVELERERSFNEYYPDINRLLQAKGMQPRTTVTQLESIDTKELTKEINKAKKEKHLIALFEAKPLEEKQLAAVEMKKRRGEHITKSDLLALEKQTLIRDYHPTDSEPTIQELMTYLSYKDKGIRTGRNHIANGLMTLRQVRLVEKALLLDDEYQRDITQKAHIQTRANWELDRVLCDLIGVQFNETTQSYEFKNPELVIGQQEVTSKNNGRSVTQRLSECLDNFNAANPNQRIYRKQLKENPLKTVIELAQKRLKVRFRKFENAPLYYLSTDQPVLDALNIAAKRGVIGLARLANAMELKQVLDQDGQLSGEACKRLGIDSEIKAFMTQVFEKLPSRKHKPVLARYVAIAESPRTQGDNFAPIARANHYLHDVLSGKAA